MKHCKKCERTLDESEFCKAKDKKDGLRPNCKQCTRAKSKEHYTKGKTEYLQRNRRRKEELKSYLYNVLTKSCCADCGISDPVVLEFDHMIDKEDNISGMLRDNLSIRALDLEIAKCQVRCGNCHQRKTSEEQGWYSDIVDEVKRSTLR